MGYETIANTISISAGTDLEVNFQLMPSSQNLSEVVVTGKRETGYIASELIGVTFGTQDVVDVPQSFSVITQERFCSTGSCVHLVIWHAMTLPSS